MLELPDRRVTVAQAVQQPDPHRFAQDAETLRDELDQGLWERVRGLEAAHDWTLTQAMGCVVDKLAATPVVSSLQHFTVV